MNPNVMPFIASGFAPPSAPTYDAGALDEILGLKPPSAPVPAPMPPIAPAPFDLGLDASPGIMQDPSVQNPLRDNLLTALTGLKSAQMDSEKNYRRQTGNGRRFMDELSARVLLPAWGGATDHREEAWKASKQILDTMEQRDSDRLSSQSDKMRLIDNLSRIIQQSDPNDFANVLKQSREDRLLDKSEFDQSYKTRQGDLKDKEFKLKESHTAEIERLAKTKEARLDSDTQQKIDLQRERLQMDKEAIREKLAIARSRNDLEEMRILLNDQEKLLQLESRMNIAELDLRKHALDQERGTTEKAAEVDKDGNKKYPGLKPVPAQDYISKVQGDRATAGVYQGPGGKPINVPADAAARAKRRAELLKMRAQMNDGKRLQAGVVADDSPEGMKMAAYHSSKPVSGGIRPGLRANEVGAELRRLNGR